MLAIRMQRTGRKGHATYRVIVQESRLSPTSGRLVALIGNYDPHQKSAVLVKDKAEFYLKNGARPSPRVARLFKTEGIALPSWVSLPDAGTRSIRNPDKLRRNRPAEPKVAKEEPAATETPAPAEASVTDEVEAIEPVIEAAPQEAATEVKADETPAETEA